MGWVGRDLKDDLVPTPLSRAEDSELPKKSQIPVDGHTLWYWEPPLTHTLPPLLSGILSPLSVGFIV